MVSHMRTRLALAALLALAAALLPAAGAGAATTGARGNTPHFEKCSPGCDILVNSQKDLPDLKPGDGKCRASTGRCTLRAAVQEANARKQTQAKPRRTLVRGGHYTRSRHGADDNAGRGDLDLLFHGEVVGAGASKTTVDGDRADRVFDMRGLAARVAHLTVTKGLATDGPGGAIRTGGGDYSYIQYVYASDSEAAATDAPLSGSGGGLAAIGPAVVTESTFQYNRAVNGGGVFWNAAESNLRLDTVANNHATEDGGGVYWNTEDNEIMEDTISSNRADARGGGMFLSPAAGWLSLLYVTIASNTTPTGGGGGVWREVYPQEETQPRTAPGPITARNGAGADCAGRGGLESRGFNLDSDTSCAF